MDQCVRTHFWLGPLLASQLKKAIAMQKTHDLAFKDHNKTFNDATITKWMKMVEDWEADLQKPNQPEACGSYLYNISITTLMSSVALNVTEVWLELAKEEAADAAQGIERGHDLTPSKFLIQGLELEEQQCVLFHPVA